MKMKNEEDIIFFIQEDEWMMEILKTVKSFHLPDWWICAGFVRSKIWDVLHGFEGRTPLPDIDVIYYDCTTINEEKEKVLEKKLASIHPCLPWSVKNQARMHLVNNVSPYVSSEDAMSKFPETATALGVKLDEKDNVLLSSPCGVKDVLNLEIKPTTYFQGCTKRMKIFEERLKTKNWQSTWYKIKLFRNELWQNDKSL
ncbi:nucleotidyltransferase family protein [Pseudogracilibacillus auburnensis]|uniref:Nucleotidyltransferase-like protein n=1 Tax=Pseudogracilibacillus auburnensis TaxID=1494959 RepID=A0A2V3VQG9_9BACI|nr:nucleotidyltransferase family protein [Pseudogracilibacillus auburnensis]MBO1001325.1 nucleotidyltransferase family protein [Pseudogracilibacillus auburnensis]PXW83810.1 hypothetical protein DFR56_11495 [Pseudogracilibacillus auburnensis]